VAKSKKYPGVYTVQGKRGTSYGIDYINPITDQRVRKIVKGAKSERDAAKYRGIELADAERGKLDQAYGLRAKQKPMTFEKMASLYLEWAKENLKDPRTVKDRISVLNRYFGRKLLTDITPWMVEKFKMTRAKEVTKSTVNTQLSVLRQIFVKAIEWKRFSGPHPMTTVRQFKIPKGKKPGALTPEQAQAIIDAVPYPVRQDMVRYAFYTGWRIGEIRRLKWDHVDFEEGTAYIVDPKNRQSVELELAPEALEVIKRQPKRGEYVFCKIDGRPYTTNMRFTIKNAAKKAGVYLPPRKAWHIFRRTWATMMLQSGCDVETLRVLGNWKDASMPLWYAEAAGRPQRKAILKRLPKLEWQKNGRNKKVVSLSTRKD